MEDNRAKNRLTEEKFDRVPVSGTRDIMAVLGKEKGFVYRWVIDTDERGSRIWKFKRGGWDFSPLSTDGGDIVIGQEAVYKTEQDGSIVRLHTGAGKYSYLMRIKEEWYHEDQKAKADAINEVEKGLTRDADSDSDVDGQYGSVKVEKTRR